MRNSKNDRIKQNKLDASYDSYKYNYQKNMKKLKKIIIIHLNIFMQQTKK
jgi:hypothetical protein